MWIDYVKMKNFRQYRDIKVTFARPEEERNFTIIQGANGAGKTNLLNAITWCLYGEEMHISKKYAGLPIVNTSTLEELDVGQSCELEVEIQMCHEGDEKIVFRRSQQFRKSGSGKLQRVPYPLSTSPNGSRFEMIRQKGMNWISVTEPSYVLGRLIPKSIEQYFFFDGERLNDYFREVTSQKIRDSVFKVSQIGLLETMIGHLNKMRNQYLFKLRGLSPEAEEIRKELKIYQEAIDNAKDELEKLREQKEEAAKKEEEYSEKLRSTSVADVTELEKRRIELEKELEEIQRDIEECESEKIDFLVKFAPLIAFYEPLVKVKRMISERQEAGEIPPDYKRSFLEKLLKKGECICGTDISKENQHKRKILDLLMECDKISDISQELITINAKVGSMLRNLKSFRKDQIQHSKKIKSLEDKRKIKSRQVKEIHERISEFDIEQIKQWESKRREWKRIKEDLISEIAKKEIRFEDAKRAVNKLINDLKKEMRKEEKYKETSRILAFCDESLHAAKKVKNEIMEDVKKEVEERTRKQFFDLIWKKETYKDVRIDDQYNVSVIHQTGMESLGTLSAGERQVLALSFMAALNNVSGFDVPIIIDTPLGRLSRRPKANIANNLPHYLKGKQVTLLVTEEEYTPEVRERLANRVGKEYIIQFKEMGMGNIAEVIPYGS